MTVNRHAATFIRWVLQHLGAGSLLSSRFSHRIWGTVIFALAFASLADAQIYLTKVTGASLGGKTTYAPGDTLTINFVLANGSSPATQVNFGFATSNGYGRTVLTKSPAGGSASIAITGDWPNGTYRLSGVQVYDAVGRGISYRSDGSLSYYDNSVFRPAPGPTLDSASLTFTVTGGLTNVTSPTLTSLRRTSGDVLTAGNPVTFDFTLQPGSAANWKIFLTMYSSEGLNFTSPTLENVHSGTLSLPTSPDWTNGTYRVLVVGLYDANSSTSYQRGDSSGFVPLTTDFQLAGGASSVVFPRLLSISRTGPASFSPGQTFSLGFAATPGTSAIASVDFSFSGSVSTLSASVSSSNSGTASLTVGSDWVNGTYSLSTITVTDTFGRRVTYDRRGYWISYPSGNRTSPSLDLSPLDFRVIGAVTTKPFITTQPQGGTVQPGTSLALNVVAVGMQALSYQWYLGLSGDTSTPAPASSNSYAYTPAPTSSTASYWVRVSDGNDTVDSAGATIAIAYPNTVPTIITQPQDFRSTGPCYGGLSVFAVGPPPLTYQWFKDGTALVGAISSQLDLTSAHYTASGNYTVKVTNSNGSATSVPAIVDIQETPVIVTQPVSKTATVGDTVTLTVSATGGGLGYTWFQDGITSSALGTTGPDGTLTIAHISAQNAGTYCVYVSNNTGTRVRSNSVTLTVVGGPAPTVTVDPVAYGALNEFFGLTIRATNSPTAFSATGLAPGLSINNSGGITGTPTMSGTFPVTVNVTNVGGTTAASFSIVIAPGPYAPVITQQPQSQTAVLRTNVVFSVAAAGSTAPGFSLNYQWYYNGQPIPSAYGSSYTVTIDSVDRAGDYAVAVSGSAGTTPSVTVHLTVDATRSAPFFTAKTVPDQTVAAGDAANLSVPVNGTPPFTLQWWYRGTSGYSYEIPGATDATWPIASATVGDMGQYFLKATNAYGSIYSPSFGLIVTYSPRPNTQSISVGQTANLTVPTSDAVRSYQWYQGESGDTSKPMSGAVGASFTTPPLTVTTNYWVRVTGPDSVAMSATSTVQVVSSPVAPAILTQPQPQTANAGTNVTFSIAASGTVPLSYQWRKGGTAIAGATNATLTLANVAATDAGNYSVVVSNTAGSVTSAAATLTVNGTRLSAISCRAVVGTGGDVLIPGIIIGGTGSKQVIVRASGPALIFQGVTGTLAQPQLSLYSGSTVIAQNIGWSSGTAANTSALQAAITQVGLSQFPSGSADCALLATLAPGVYTAIISGVNNSTGVALVEVYELGTGSSNLSAISCRAVVGAGGNVLIPGIIVNGTGQKKVLVRVSGPALIPLGVTGTLAQPQLSLYSGSTVIAQNIGWSSGSATDISALQAAVTQLGLTPFPAGSADCALLATLSPGGYTAIISGVNNTTGVALIEVYEVP